MHKTTAFRFAEYIAPNFNHLRSPCCSVRVENRGWLLFRGTCPIGIAFSQERLSEGFFCVLLIVGVCDIFSHLHPFPSSHLHISSSHLRILSSSHLHISSSHLRILKSAPLRIFSSSHLHISSLHLHICTFSHVRISSSHLHTCAASHLHFFTSAHVSRYFFLPRPLFIFSLEAGGSANEASGNATLSQEAEVKLR